MTDYNAKAQELAESFPDDLDADVSEIADSLQELVEEYNVQMEEAVRSTTDKYMRDYDGDESMDNQASGEAQDQDVEMGDLTVAHDEEWMNLHGTVQSIDDLTDNQAEWIAQKGVIGDDTGKTTFTVFHDAVEENPSLELEEGESYELIGVVGDAYQGSIGVKLVTSTTVKDSDETFDVPDNDTHITGCFVDMQDGSGLIKRCPEDGCNLTLSSGQCTEHGDVDGEFDIRLMAVIDDGVQVHEVFFGREATEHLTGIDLADAIEIAEDAMNTEAVIEEMKPMLLGRYYEIAGNQLSQYVIVNGFERVTGDWDAEADRILDTLGDSEVSA